MQIPKFRLQIDVENNVRVIAVEVFVEGNFDPLDDEKVVWTDDLRPVLRIRVSTGWVVAVIAATAVIVPLL